MPVAPEITSFSLKAGTSNVRKVAKSHPFHRYGDLELRSTDNTIFKVMSQRLVDVSDVFKNMLEIGNSDVTVDNKRKFLDAANVINTGLSTPELEIFLDLISVAKPMMPDVNYATALNLFDFCDKFDVNKRVRNRVGSELFLRAKLEGFQWDLLIWAANHNDLTVAREALERMNNIYFLIPSMLGADGKINKKLFWEAMSMLPAAWQIALLRLSLTSSHNLNPRHMSVCRDWKGLAEKFQPV
ncbi:uncharacterized protein I206_100579 [Kwoniella pini CBS 10737]|uniref:BTB domain-containing protein n=1 Tax=Kwoniella pini CBS 10737 TaxID=1296096 RepID=A0A1B9ID71_9TREE|nr:uncharacterized protein I206_00746 [Kwoniella pini CBS 10737]OCF53443.1 hypothetical protein I206_00746 [Kwoniella pini CBS 10737]